MKKFKIYRLIALSVFVLALPLSFHANAQSLPKTVSRVDDTGGNSPSTPDVGSCGGNGYISSDNKIQDNVIVVCYIKPAIEFLSAGVGVVVIIMLIMGAIQYITSDGSPQAVGAAKKKMINAVLALLAFFLLFAFLNFIVPGGVFNTGIFKLP